MTLDWVARLAEAVGPLIPNQFVGRIEINAFKGGISNINVQQSFKDFPQPLSPSALEYIAELRAEGQQRRDTAK